ncbi:MAG: cysteine desulfurase family protein [Promethearchaeota archaeon]
MNVNGIIYLDYQAAKPVDPAVIKEMELWMSKEFGNPSSLHVIGDHATSALMDARKTVADFINAGDPSEVIFTSGATESNNLALIGFARRNKRKGRHVIISEIEHISIHNICKYLQREGFEISKVPVDFNGFVRLDKLQERIRADTILISVQHANNEIGTIQPIDEIGEIASERGIAFHVDAVASEGLLPIDVQKSRIDLLTLSSNDIYGPRGVGALRIRKGLGLKPIIIGGGQERGLRSGSENVAGIVGMAKAAEIAKSRMDSDNKKLVDLRDRLIRSVLDVVPRSYLNGPRGDLRLPNNAHFRFDYIEGESLLLSLKDEGIAVSTGSACSSKTLEPSHALIAIGLLHEEAHGSLEVTFGRWSTGSDVDRLVEILPAVVEKLRKISPLAKESD